MKIVSFQTSNDVVFALCPCSVRTRELHEPRGSLDHEDTICRDYESLVQERTPGQRHVPLSVYFDVIANGDRVHEKDPDHSVRMGPGQRSGMKRLLRALDAWSFQCRYSMDSK